MSGHGIQAADPVKRSRGALDTCALCRFYAVDGTARAAADRLGVANLNGTCRRYPQHIRRQEGEWCGEFDMQPGK